MRNDLRSHHLEEVEDVCCYLYIMCNTRIKREPAHVQIWNVPHCDCEVQFRQCLENIEEIPHFRALLGFYHSLFANQCYSYDYPIEKCVRFESLCSPKTEIDRSPNSCGNESSFIRCVEYKLDENKPKQYQLFDIPFNYHQVTYKDEDFKNIRKVYSEK